MSNTDEIGSSNKLTKWAVFLVALLLVPTLLASEWSLDFFQRRLSDKADRTWAPDAQEWIAWIYGNTLRPERSAERYKWTADLMARHGRHAEAGEALYQQAAELEAIGGNHKYEAMPVYQYVSETYKDYPAGAKAHGALIRLKTMSRP